MYLDNNRELQSEFGPRVHEGPIRRRNAARHNYISRENGNRRIETNLIAHLGSHSDAITGIAVSPDHMFFVSASDDKTVKVWDTARLERNVTSKARYTYGQHHAKVKAICMIEGTHCFASAAEDGNIHVVRVHVNTSQGATAGLPKYGRVQVIREHRLETPGEYATCMIHYTTRKLILDTILGKSDHPRTASSSSLLYGTTHAMITILDLRTLRVLQNMQNPQHYGPITSVCIDRKRTWLVCGTTTGVLSLWDLRFGILIKSWTAGASLGEGQAKIYQCSLHPTKGKGRWIIVALGSHHSTKDQGSDTSSKLRPLIEVWDIEKTVLVETYGTRTVASASQPLEDPVEAKTAEAEPSPAAAIAALVRARQETHEAPSSLVSRRRSSSQRVPTLTDNFISQSPEIMAFALGSEFGGHTTLARTALGDHDDSGSGRQSGSRGFMICGSDDRKLRMWDLGKVDRSVVLCSPDEGGEKPTYRYVKVEAFHFAMANQLVRAAQPVPCLDRRRYTWKHVSAILPVKAIALHNDSR
jgi:phosphoinositide-3-kinase, regulatory subunit 4